MDSDILRNKPQISLQYITGTIHNRQQLQRVAVIAAVSAAAYLVTSKLYRAFFSPLSCIPGPPSLKFFSFQFFGDVEKIPGTSYQTLIRWHKDYGPVVRIGPHDIMISDKDLLKQVLQTDDAPKGPSYDLLAVYAGANVFTTTDKLFHKQRRRVISPAFSVKYLSSLEPFMRSMTEAFVHRIDAEIQETHGPDGYGTVDIWVLLKYLALDIIGETAFGNTFNMLEGSDHLVPRNISKTMEIATYIIMHPILGPFKALFSLGNIMSSISELQGFMKEIVTERRKGSGNEARRDDILQILIDTQHAKGIDDRLTEKHIANETVLFLVAGSETTSSMTAFTIIELLKNPHTLDALRAEIDAIPMKQDQQYFYHDQLKCLPYLNAVINESLRLNTIIVDGAERFADRDMVLGDHLFVPKGTGILCNMYDAHINPKYWPEPTTFIPERWLPGSTIPADTDAFFPFSIGSRNCIGKGFAQQEMRLSIAQLIKFYDLKAIPKELIDAEERRSFITLRVKNDSFKVKIKRR